MSTHVLSLLVEDKPGLLTRVAGLFSRRGYTIFSLAVSPTEDEQLSRMTVVVDAESAPLEQITKQLNKVIPVIKITELASKIDDVGHDAITIQVAGTPEKLDAMTDLLQPFGIAEQQRTGRIALPKLSRRPAKLRAVRSRTV